MLVAGYTQSLVHLCLYINRVCCKENLINFSEKVGWQNSFMSIFHFCTVIDLYNYYNSTTIDVLGQ